MTKPKHEQPTRPRPWKRILLILILVVVAAGLLFIGYRYYAKDQQVDRITSGILNEQEKTFADNVQITGRTGTVTSDTMKPVVNYYQQHPHELAVLKDQLEQNNAAPNGFRLVKKGTYFGIFPHYRLAITPIRPIIQTNAPGATIKVDGHSIGQTDAEQQLQAPALIPGFHSVKVTAEVDGQHLSAFKQTSFFANEHQKVTVPLAMLSFRVKGPAGAEIYVNDQRRGTIANDGTGAVTDVPMNQQNTTWLQVNVDGQTVRSENRTLTKRDNGKLLSYTFPSVVSKDDSFQLFQNLWTGIGNATNLNRSLDDQNVAGSFQDGTNNPDYQALNDVVKQNQQSHLQFGTIHLQIEKVQPLNDNASLVTYRVQSDVKVNDTTGTLDNRYQARVAAGAGQPLEIQTNQIVQ
ncbi:PEGA domain-containing protein [Fructilactobacillus myrtifloralis]|uniref:PEGA domain-containing protein n=1 Tax=Fructilactobacillus myrtifloralis TaxID=2940301 RepID=A0ABY5BMM2_9LACO|nr:PEGA domain-containing protein [Fructilactobacillus myrtifloralis]USS84830.1 PEGA domain-containing protein [Fructilactobacillus myrtifloralis]